jgi:IS5 family transposase
MPGGTPEKKQRKHYSGKKKRHTHKAQVIADKSSNKIVATAFCSGKTHDITLYQESRTVLLARTLCLGDSGYQGIGKQHKNSQTPQKKSKHHRLSKEERAANRALSRERLVIEHVIGRLKVFRILCERYRNRRKRFGLRFNLIAAIYNMEC